MVERIEFTRNYSDLSTNQGFQFEFYCDRCGGGFRTRFKPSMLGAVSGAMDTASSLFGGLFGKAADLSERVTMHFPRPPVNCSQSLPNARAAHRGCAAKTAGIKTAACVRTAHPTWALK